MRGLIVFVICTILLVWMIFGRRLKRKNKTLLSSDHRFLLNDNVAFYRSLNDADKFRFEEKIKDFLGYVGIYGVRTEVNELDKLLVASSAVIPIFGFDNWHYHNLRYVLLYENAFNSENFSTTDIESTIGGMVGTGAMQQMMILSKPALRLGFKNEAGTYNTGIHEFVHLLDKADGAIDGIPEQLMKKQYTIPWLNLMNETIEKIKQGNSDINPYGATSKTEFFAVAAEYVFQRPDLFKQNHPELFALMEKVFRQTSPGAGEIESPKVV
jgi:Mlc titration factor MtfA (ptsG expression regulator)